ncbi:MAG: hypothetical protein HZR80_06620 [Candidatus Heimdallarchaeota archaeon]
MKFIVFWEYNADEIVVVIKKFQKLENERKKYPEIISGPFMFNGEAKGITVCNAESDEQIVNLHLYHQPELRLSFVPIMNPETALDLISQKK